MQLNVEIYDQYMAVYAQDNTTLVHPSTGVTYSKGVVSDINEAKQLVTKLYAESKLLGNYNDVIINLDEAYAELFITFDDGRQLNRVIYPINR
jgi:hypothetical protein